MLVVEMRIYILYFAWCTDINADNKDDNGAVVIDDDDDDDAYAQVPLVMRKSASYNFSEYMDEQMSNRQY